MSYKKTFLCLACSRKPEGRCVAGKEWSNGSFGGWIRPVTPGEDSAITNEQRKYANDYYAVVLDYVEAQFTGQQTDGFQAENHFILQPSKWRCASKAQKSILAQLADTPKQLWSNECSDSSNGTNDRVLEATLTTHCESLFLIKVNDLAVHIEELEGKKPKVRGEFLYNGESYKFRITDPKFEQKFETHKAGVYESKIDYLTISLGEAFEGYAYKLIAAVF
ncbi:hypothetical protein [Pseudomonas sp. SLFW]|uniref:dual OB domain-containing protein n=1 Tax=Pseudomonas sp. SLFW TaxID=2683259 RepID=UPI00141366A9|nr:hypothetical protein [Pseudomonas sp. SLFW]NBB11241.1 hypothetical protein [Pseudomonas sp. SLFW]